VPRSAESAAPANLFAPADKKAPPGSAGGVPRRAHLPPWQDDVAQEMESCPTGKLLAENDSRQIGTSTRGRGVRRAVYWPAVPSDCGHRRYAGGEADDGTARAQRGATYSV
jgi:hypothetical protein